MPSPSPCACCGPAALTPKGAFVTVSGVKNKPYPDCEECTNFNGTFIIVFPVEGCTYSEQLSFCGSNAYVELGLGSDPANSCRMRYVVQLNGNAGGAGVAYFEKGNLQCCYAPVTLDLTSSLNEVCDFTEATVVVTPFGDWSMAEIANAGCIPQLTKTCPNTYPVLMPSFSDLSQELDSTCSTCKCSSPGPQPALPTPTACPTCSAGLSASPINGNLSIALATPATGSLAPTERFYYNSAPVFGPNSPYADTQMQAPPAGSHVAGVHSIRLIDKGSTTEANVVRCDGSIDLYRCKNATTRVYEPKGNRNSLVENVNGSGVRTGWTEFTRPDGFRYEYNDTGVLQYIQNPAGQRWTMVRSSGTLTHIVDPLARRTSFSYASGKMSRVQDVYGRITSLTVDVNGNLTQVISPELCATTLRYGSGYASSHQLIALIDSSGVRTSFAYDSNGWISSITAPGGGVTQYNYTDWLNATVSDPLGNVTTIVFDEARQISSVTAPGLNPFSVRSDCTKALQVIEPSGATTSFVYDDSSALNPRLTASVNQDGRTTWIYASGSTSFQPDASIDPLGNRTSCIWNSAGQKNVTINAMNERTTYLYDAQFRLTATVNPLGFRNSLIYNAASQVSASISPTGMRISHSYSNGQRIATKNAVGAISTTLYDRANRRIASIDPLGNRTTNVFSAGCLPVATVNAVGARQTSIYNNGRQVASMNPLGQRTSFAWNAAHQQVRVQTPLGRITTTVYAKGRPLASISPVGLRSSTVYDTAGRVAASIDPTGLRSTTIYDTCCSRPKATIAPSGSRTSFAYNKLGSQIRTTGPTGAISTTIYDVLNRPVTSIDALGKRSTTVYDPAGRTVASVNALNQRSTTVYNAASQSVASVNALGIRSTQIYDAAGQGIASVNPLGERWTTVYDLAGRRIASVDPLNRRSTSVYNNVGAVTASINPAGSRSTTVYNIAGQTIASIDARNARSTITYNADGQSVASINALGFRTTSLYDAGGRGVASVSANGSRSTTVYDSTGRTVASINPLGKRWTTIFSNVGQTVGSKDPLGNRNTSVYDTAGRVVASINPLGKRTTTIYNIASQVLATVDANGNRVSRVYDALDRRTVEINALGNRTTTVYNSLGQTSALIDARGNRHSFTYDFTGAQTQLIDPLNRRTTSAYDAAGQQNLRIDARSNRTTYTFNSIGQLTGRKYPDGSRATFAYDTVGNRTLMADSTGRYTSTYNAVGQTMVTASPNNQRQTFSYDAIGLRRSMDSAGSGRFTSSYDAASQLTSLVNPFAERTTFSYDDSGRRTVQRNANGTRVSTIYDAASQTTQVIHRTSTNATLLQLDYRYDNAGNRNAMIEGSGSARVTWSYDKQNQLTGESRTGTNAYRQTFTYDAAGNRTLKNIDAVRTTYVYDAANQLHYGQAAAGRTTFVYDATGNQRIEQPPTGARPTTTWNYENQPTQYRLSAGSSPVTMTYNADNRRVLSQQGTSTTKFVWDSVTDAYISELDGQNVLIATYTNEPQHYGAVISQRRGSTSHTLHTDALGTTRLLTNSTQTASDTYLFDAWGNPIASTGSTANPFKWVGRYGYYQDSTNGLLYVRARMYQSTVARWCSVDPLETIYVRENGFWYCNVSPVIRIDSSGLSPCLNKGLCRSAFCSTTGPHGFSEGINYFCGYLVDNGSCLASKMRYFLRSNSSTFANGAFKECGDPAQKEISSLFRRGQDFELVSYFDVQSPKPSGVFEGCHLIKKQYALDINRCYDLTFEWECDLKCGRATENGTDTECILPKSDYVLGAWTRNPVTGSISQREEIATFLLGFDTTLKTSPNSCACPIGACEVSVGLHWANNTMVWYEPGTTKPAGAAMTQNCDWNDLPQVNGGKVGPGNPGNARLPEP